MVFGGIFCWRMMRGHMKQFYIIMSTMGTFKAMDFVYTGEFSHSCAGGIEGWFAEKIVEVCIYIAGREELSVCS